MEKLKISDPIVLKYLYGNPSLEEVAKVIKATIEDPELNEQIVEIQRANAFVDNLDDTFLPALKNAASDSQNLCDFQCEMYILKKLGIEIDEDLLKETARDNAWLNDDGTPLHNIGRLLAQQDMSVTRRYNATGDDVKQAIAEGLHVIVVVNKEMLYGQATEDTNPNHAIVVLSYNHSGQDKVSIYDSDREEEITVVDKSNFDAAWETSAHHLVLANDRSKKGDYVPHPIDTADVELEPTLYELQEAIAENAHEVWADTRQQQGWTYGPERNDTLKQTPDMVPYGDLPDEEKKYDREMSSSTLKLVKKLGYIIEKKDSGYHCPCCNAIVRMHFIYCPTCGQKIPTSVFV